MNIGILDSGIGGLGIFRELREKISKYDVTASVYYLADNINFPFGEKSDDAIRRIVCSDVEYLKTRCGTGVIVLACNTATVAAIAQLREAYKDVKFVGAEPSIKPACKATKTGKIAVLATDVTVRSVSVKRLVENYAGGTEVLPMACPDLVRIAEENLAGTKEAGDYVKSLFAGLAKRGIDVVVLGCTHFTLIRDRLEALLPVGMSIMDSNEPVARQALRVFLRENGVISDKEYENFTEKTGTGSPLLDFKNDRILYTGEGEKFVRAAMAFLNRTITCEKVRI